MRWPLVGALVLAAASVLAASCLVPLAGAAGAAVPTGVSEDDCDALFEFQTEVVVIGPETELDAQDVRAAAKGMAAAAKDVDDEKLKKAMQRVVKVYRKIARADGEDAYAIVRRAGSRYTDSLLTVSSAGLDCIDLERARPGGATVPSTSG